MLRRVSPQKSTFLPIKAASYPLPFPSQLEFNPPVHGTWNIVHSGMQLPQSHQIYVCAANCMRGVVLTAAEMNAPDRFSMVILEEHDLLEGTVEDITVEGTADAIRKLPKRPPVVLLFTVCVHHFLGCDLERIYAELGEIFPDITFIRCYMDPIMRKNGMTPDQKLRRSMVEVFPTVPPRRNQISLLGGDFPLPEASQLRTVLRENGWNLREITDCKTFSEYLSLGESELFLCIYPAGAAGVELGAKRLGRSYFYLPQCFGYEEIQNHWQRLCRYTGITPPDFALSRQKCEEALQRAQNLIGDCAIAIDASFHPRPLGLARLLLAHGFNVERVYLDAVSPEEEMDFRWLQKNTPQLTLRPIIRPEMRVEQRGSDSKLLALGQKAAWFENTPYFVNLVQGGGLWGYDGIVELCELMEDAFLYEKNTRDIVPRKGLGCESCV